MIIKQITPLIHFEAEEKNKNILLRDKNILLRASELKPRITKFIKEEFLNYYDGEKDFEKLIKNEEIFSEKGCSYFKLKISPSTIKNIYKYKTYIPKKDKHDPFFQEGSYFGDHLAVKIEETEIEVFSYIKPLKELVEEAFKYFFVLYNLGARQTKGFGGFIVKGTTKEEFEKILKKKYKTIFFKTSKKPLKTILEDYQLLKSGRNRPYRKSLLFQYFAKKNIGWEKRRIKEAIVNRCPDEAKKIAGIKRHMPGSDFEEYRYIRAMLGLAGNISFLKKYEYIQRNDRYVKIDIKHSNQNNEKEIQKFASPILFKVYDDTIYALPNKIPSKIFNQKFVFKASKKNCGRDKFLCELATPDKFDLEEFLSEYLTKQGWRKL